MSNQTVREEREARPSDLVPVSGDALVSCLGVMAVRKVGAGIRVEYRERSVELPGVACPFVVARLLGTRLEELEAYDEREALRRTARRRLRQSSAVKSIAFQSFLSSLLTGAMTGLVSGWAFRSSNKAPVPDKLSTPRPTGTNPDPTDLPY